MLHAIQLGLETVADNVKSFYTYSSTVMTWQFVLIYGGIALGAYLLHVLIIQQFLSPLRKVSIYSYFKQLQKNCSILC